MAFNLLCAPCFAAMGAIKREMNNTKWFWIAIGYQCGLAYLVSLCVARIGMLVTGAGFSVWTIVAFAIVDRHSFICCSVRIRRQRHWIWM